jgi:hypothetical protein
MGTPAATLQTFPATVLALRKRDFRRRHDGWRPDDLGMEGRDQYSSASMTVITRTVTAGSVGSGDRYFRFRSK